MAARTRRPPRSDGGFSVLEALVALAIAAVLFMLGAPAWQEWIDSRRLMNQAQALAGMLTLARTEAIKRGQRISVCKSPDGQRCADRGGWDMGFLMHGDPDPELDAVPEGGALRTETRAPGGITIAANGPVEDYVSFTSVGHARRLDGALQMGTFTVCRPGRNAVLVVVANTGRVRIESSAVRCS